MLIVIEDELLPEYIEWEGPGYYASRQLGVHDSQYIDTRFVGSLNDDYDELSSWCYKNFFGNPHEMYDMPK